MEVQLHGGDSTLNSKFYPVSISTVSYLRPNSDKSSGVKVSIQKATHKFLVT